MSDVVLVEVVTDGVDAAPLQIIDLPDDTDIVPDLAYRVSSVAELSQTATVQNPVGTPGPVQQFVLRLTSSLPQGLLWGSKYLGGASLALPSATTGGGLTDYLGFIRYEPDDVYHLIAYASGY